MNVSVALDAWGVPLEQRERDCAAGFHFYGPDRGGYRTCVHCRESVDTEEFFAEAVAMLVAETGK